MVNTIKIILAIFGILAIGDVVLRAIEFRQSRTKTLEKIALSFGFGSGTISLVMFLVSYWGAPLNFTTLTVFLFLFFLCFLLMERKYLPSSLKIGKLFTSLAVSFKGINIFQVILILLILLSILLTIFDAILKPIILWDARGIWGYTAKILYHRQTLYAQELFDEDGIHPHPNYPLLVPLLESYIYIIIGHVNDRLVKIIFPLFFVSLIIIFYTAQRNFFSRTHALFFTFLLSTLPLFIGVKHGSVSSAYADLPLSFFYTASIIYTFLWMKTRNTSAIIIGSLFWAFVLFTKNEGLGLFITNLFVLAIFMLLIFKKENIKPFLLYMLVPMIITLPWFIFRARLPAIDENYPAQFTVSNILQHIPRFPIIASFFWQEFINYKYWNILWVVLSLSTIFTIKQTFSKPLIYLLLTLFSTTSMYFITYMITPWNVTWHLNVSLSRLFMHIAPTAIFLISNQVAEGKLILSVKS